MTNEIAALAREMKKPMEFIEAAVQLLDEGNTIPFITRFRKDQTGGLDEEQLLAIKERLARHRALEERREFILKSIESQGKLDDELRRKIKRAKSSRALEDLYLPFKPKKQTLAATARQQGLEPLANDIFEGVSPDIDLATRATQFVRVDKGLSSVDEVIQGVRHILAERFADRGDLRAALRELIWKNGQLTTSGVGKSAEPNQSPDTLERQDAIAPTTAKPVNVKEHSATASLPAAPDSVSTVETTERTAEPSPPTATRDADGGNAEELNGKELNAERPTAEEPNREEPTVEVSTSEETNQEETNQEETNQEETNVGEPPAAVESGAKDGEPSGATGETPPPDGAPEKGGSDDASKPDRPAAQSRPKSKKRKQKRKKKQKPDPWADYDAFAAPLKGLPYHRVLAVNRGERMNRLKVRIDCDEASLLAQAVEICIPDDHPFREFLESCLKNGLNRLMLPSLEREIRRELTEAAEQHAVRVFARNLKSLLLQRPTPAHVILAIDPGFKHGCSVAVLDPFGRLLESAHFYIIGNERRRSAGKETLANLVRRHGVTLIAIGNGAGSRETEQLVSDLIEAQFADSDLRYAIVNEAGASHYSTSELARDELPGLPTSVRSAVSIGRRLLDPLSELVKISPANIGVGMYQHDVKAKHLAETLDEVVQSCVNRVGVNVNTASPALLKYVSGLNQLTARRVYEYRAKHGPFKHRDELKNVTGIGDATFVQAAGFLKIIGGSEPLDSTLIHPESYPLARRILERVGGTIEELIPPVELVTDPLSNKPEHAENRAASGAGTSPQSDSDDAGDNATSESAQVSAPDPSALVEGAESALPREPVPDGAAESSDTPQVDSANDLGNASADDSENANEDSGIEVPTESSASADAGATEAAPSDREAGPTPVNGGDSSTDVSPAENPTGKSSTLAPTRPKAPALSAEFVRRRKELIQAIRRLNIDRLAEELSVGKMLARDLVLNLIKPDYDPRSKTLGPVVRRGILKLEQLEPGMELTGMVINVVDFGVFVDIGLNTTSLVHVSQLRSRYVRDPHDFYAVGDTIQVWVESIDTKKRQVKLTAIRPQSETTDSHRGKRGQRRHPHRHDQKRPEHAKRKHRRPRSKPKPAQPISEEMLAGKAPMRSFADLAQFFSKKGEPSDKDSQ